MDEASFSLDILTKSDNIKSSTKLYITSFRFFDVPTAKVGEAPKANFFKPPAK